MGPGLHGPSSDIKQGRTKIELDFHGPDYLTGRVP
jgi:hypothetical protein